MYLLYHLCLCTCRILQKEQDSTESLERALKRSKPFDTKTEKNIYPVIKTVSISTKTPPSEYNQVNQLLHSVHVEQFGNPETRESWWEQNDVKCKFKRQLYVT
ncbi:unnamed protein product [Rhizopus stolonifer]